MFKVIYKLKQSVRKYDDVRSPDFLQVPPVKE